MQHSIAPSLHHTSHPHLNPSCFQQFKPVPFPLTLHTVCFKEAPLPPQKTKNSDHALPHLVIIQQFQRAEILPQGLQLDIADAGGAVGHFAAAGVALEGIDVGGEVVK